MKALSKFLLSTLIYFSQNCLGQRSFDTDLIKRFREDVKIELEENGRLIWDNETQETFCLLMSNTPFKLLLEYADDSIPAVRSNVFAGLTKTNIEERALRDILSQHANDTAKFTAGSGCLVITHTVVDFMQLAFDNRVVGNSNESKNDNCSKEISGGNFGMPLPGLRHGVITKNSLLNVDSLVYSMNELRVIAFDLIVGDKTISGVNILTTEMRDEINKLEYDKRVFFDEIIVRLPDGSTRKVSAISLKVR